jgi:threonine dehydratase
MAHPTLADVEAARSRMGSLVRATELRRSAVLSVGVETPVWLKLECTQTTGSFKIRGAASRMLALSEAERRQGVVAVSSGNHGRAVAQVAADLGLAATICLSSRVPPVKADAIRALGARVVVAGATQDDAEAAALALVAEGITYIHPFDDPLVIAGQGTIGLEILEQLPDVATVVVPLSGGGLISGIGVALKSHHPSIRLIGVSQDRGPAMHLSLAAGRLVEVVEEDTLADALAGGLGAENHHSFDMCRDLVDQTVLVSEEEIAAAMTCLFVEAGLVVEGGGAVGVAALLAGRVEPVGVTVVVISGGNVDPKVLGRIAGEAGSGRQHPPGPG